MTDADRDAMITDTSKAVDELNRKMDCCTADVDDIQIKLGKMCSTWEIWKQTRCEDIHDRSMENQRRIGAVEVNEAKTATRIGIIVGLVVGTINLGMLVAAFLQFKTMLPDG